VTPGRPGAAHNGFPLQETSMLTLCGFSASNYYN
jgi:hypothetical protein